MKLIPLLLLSLLAASPLLAQDKSKLPSRLQVLRENYQRAIERANVPIRNAYRDELIRLRAELTRAGNLNGALEVADELKAQFPDKPETPLGEKTLAGVEAADTSLTPLRKDEAVFSDRDTYRWIVLPAQFEGYQFTRSKAHAGTLRFKVLSDGLVYMACTSRFAEPTGDIVDEKLLQRKGWKRLGKTALKATNEDSEWLVFSRECRAGEEFSVRTEKYAAPILLVK